ncbi:MAG: glycoside hydrolase family 5 protein [Elainellaceae cyanobacterium]
MNLRRFLLLAIITGLILGMLSLISPKSLGVSDLRLQRLSQGVNLNRWFSQTELTHETFQTRITAEDVQIVKDLGFQHVRLPIDPEILFDEDNPARLNPDNLPYVDAALDMILEEGLAVIVDLHAEADFKGRLYNDATLVDQFAQFWQTLAEHLSHRNPDLVFLEVMNEPATEDPQIWYNIQEELLAAMRAGAPENTLIASANQRVGDVWIPIAALEELEPVSDPNVVYNFHFYEPKHFTHQGATWTWDVVSHYRNIPFPSSPQAIAPILSSIEDEQARQRLRSYGEYRWNAERLDDLISRAAAWATKHHVSVTCNEFGVFRPFAPEADRAQWHADVRRLFEQYNIGWTVWAYGGGFNIVREVNNQRTANPALIDALLGS